MVKIEPRSRNLNGAITIETVGKIIKNPNIWGPDHDIDEICQVLYMDHSML